jgi:TPR repeat protein
MKKYVLLLFLFPYSLFASEQKSLWEIYTLALRGDREAQFMVGVLFEKGSEVEQNLTQAAAWFEKSAEQGHVDAQYNLGLMYATARGVEENSTKAKEWLKKAADQGDYEARTILKKYSEDLSTSGKKSDAIEEAIVPTVLYTNENPEICNENFECSKNGKIRILTSIIKRGENYKINGIIDKKGWRRYPKVGWINEKEIERKK